MDKMNISVFIGLIFNLLQRLKSLPSGFVRFGLQKYTIV